MEATKARGELTDNPIEYHQYVRQLNQQVCMIQYFIFLFLLVSNTYFIYSLHILYIYPIRWFYL